MSTNGTAAHLPQPARSSATTSVAPLVDVHRLAVRVRLVELRGDPHRHAHAAVTGRIWRDGGGAGGGIATGGEHPGGERSARGGGATRGTSGEREGGHRGEPPGKP